MGAANLGEAEAASAKPLPPPFPSDRSLASHCEPQAGGAETGGPAWDAGPRRAQSPRGIESGIARSAQLTAMKKIAGGIDSCLRNNS